MPISPGGYNNTFTPGAVYGACTAGVNQNAGFQILPSASYITEMNTELFTTIGDGASFKFLQAGLYAVDLGVYRSDLPAGQKFIIGYSINNNSNNSYYEQLIEGQYGWNASSGPNSTRIGVHLSSMVRVQAGDYINFSVNTDDGPRTYWWEFRIMGVSK